MEERDDRTRDGSQNTHRPSGFSLRSTRPHSSQTPHERYHSSFSSNSTHTMTSLDPHWNNNNNITINNSLHQTEQKISLPPLTSLEALHTRPTSLSTEYSTPSKRPRTSVQLPPIPLPSHKEPTPQLPTLPLQQHLHLPSIHFTIPPSTIPSLSTPLLSRSLDSLHLEPRESQVSLPAVSTLLSLSSTSNPPNPPSIISPPSIVSPQPTYPPSYHRPTLTIPPPRSPQPSSFSFSPSPGAPFQYGLMSPSPHPPPSVLHSPQHQTSFHPSPSPQIVAPYSSTPSLSSVPLAAIPAQDSVRVPVQPVMTPPAASSSTQRPKPGSDTAWVNSTFFQIRWEQNYSLLKQFFQLYGHSNVTRAEGQWKPLGNWVAEQRRKLKKGKLTPDQVKKLNELGFEWDRSYYFQQGRDSSEDEPRTPTGMEDKAASTSSAASSSNENDNAQPQQHSTPPSQPRNTENVPPTEPPQQGSTIGTGGT